MDFIAILKAMAIKDQIELGLKAIEVLFITGVTGVLLAWRKDTRERHQLLLAERDDARRDRAQYLAERDDARKELAQYLAEREDVRKERAQFLAEREVCSANIPFVS